MSPIHARQVGVVVLVATVLWHLFAVLSPPRNPPPRDTAGRDYASYHYAVQAAWSGADPYDKAALEALSQAEGTRKQVHPFFYPPPFLLAVAWAIPASLAAGFSTWWVFNELALIACGLVLWRWWRPLGPEVGWVTAIVLAAMFAVAYSHELGQANFPVLALVLAGLWQERQRPTLAGALVGLACMMKMAPALVVAWWLLRGRWQAVGASVVAAIVLSVLTLPLLGVGEQLHFYRDILPRFGSGDYNGLTIKIGMFGNHSLPNLFHQAWPGVGNQLSGVARAASGVSVLALMGGLGALFWRGTDDPVRLAGQASAVLVAMLLIPVYTYEHHLVYAIPAMVLAVVAVRDGWLGSLWVGPVAASVVVLMFELPALRQLALKVVTEHNPLLFFAVQEAKFVALLVLLAATATLGRTALRPITEAPPPSPARS